jgi:ribonuclease P/MRP protein subunit RPP1
VEFARLKRTSYRGVVDVVYGGEKPVPQEGDRKKQTKGQKNQENQQNKRKADSLEGTPAATSGEEKAVSKRQQKRNKKAKLEGE